VLTGQVRETLERLKPKLEELADGYAELLDVDEVKRHVTVRLIGGRLH
jgi:hypothetical protein